MIEKTCRDCKWFELSCHYGGSFSFQKYGGYGEDFGFCFIAPIARGEMASRPACKEFEEKELSHE